MSKPIARRKRVVRKSSKSEKQTEIFPVKTYHDPKNFISSGNTHLNLALSGTPYGAYRKGTMVNIIGDSHTGKTVLALAGLGSAINNPEFDDYIKVYDEPEHALQINVAKMFSPKIHAAIDYGYRSKTVEEFRNNYFSLINAGKKVIYVLDSFDSLSSDAEVARISAAAKGNKEKGSYKTEKAVVCSELFRVTTAPLEETGSILIIVSQTRQNIGFGAMFSPKTRNGGDALDFYAHDIFWLSRLKKIIVSKELKDFPIGADIGIKCTKNKISGKQRVAKISIYNDYGLDDIGSFVNFLITEKVFIPNASRFTAVELKADKEMNKTDYSLFGQQLKKNEIIPYIEKHDLEEKVIDLMANKWTEIEEKCRIKRKPRW
jgi:RecA/RadA recombinase